MTGRMICLNGENGVDFDLDGIKKVESVPGERVVLPYDHLATRDLVLKMYALVEKEGQLPSKLDWKEALSFLEKQIQKGKLNAERGMGFGILSDGVLNASRWSNKYPDVIVPQIYTLEDHLWVPQKVESAGAFCGGEEAVYHYENSLWQRYINSRQTEKDKHDYLGAFFNGKVN